MSDTDSDSENGVELQNLVPTQAGGSKSAQPDTETEQQTNIVPVTNPPVVVVVDNGSDINSIGEFYKNKKQDICDIIKWVITIAMLMGLGFYFYYGVYLCTTIDHKYAHGTCDVYNTSIDAKCYVNHCDYYGSIYIVYSGKFQDLYGKFQVLHSTDHQEINAQIQKKYPIGLEISCYYPVKEILPLKISRPQTDGNGFIAAISIIFFVVAAVAICCCCLNVLFIFS